MSKPNIAGGIEETVKTVVIAVLIAAVFRTLFFQPFWIPSGSMKPTLLVGDFMFVNKMAYGYSKHSCPFSMCPFSGRILASDPKVGDIVVFKHPRQNVDYIKRLIGTPGDAVQVKEGVLHLNDTAVELTDKGVFTEIREPQGPQRRTPSCKRAVTSISGAVCEKDSYTESLPNDVSHKILDTTLSEADNTPRFVVPEGHYFFMGDNRDNSIDSRFESISGGVGYLPAENLIGRADMVVFSAAGNRIMKFWTWRSDRFFKRLD